MGERGRGMYEKANGELEEENCTKEEDEEEERGEIGDQNGRRKAKE